MGGCWRSHGIRARPIDLERESSSLDRPAPSDQVIASPHERQALKQRPAEVDIRTRTAGAGRSTSLVADPDEGHIDERRQADRTAPRVDGRDTLQFVRAAVCAELHDDVEGAAALLPSPSPSPRRQNAAKVPLTTARSWPEAPVRRRFTWRPMSVDVPTRTPGRPPWRPQISGRLWLLRESSTLIPSCRTVDFRLEWPSNTCTSRVSQVAKWGTAQ